MKKVALVHFAYPPNTGGVEILLREHALLLEEMGFEVLVLTGEGQEIDPKIKLIVVPELQSVLNFNPQLQKKILEEGKIEDEFYKVASVIEQKLSEFLNSSDIVIVHNMLTIVRNLPFIYAFKSFVKKNPDKKYLTWIHDHSYINEFKIKDLDKIVKSKFERDLLTNPIENITYIAISNTFRKPLAELMGMPAENIHVIPDGVNLKRFLEIDDLIGQIIDEKTLGKRFPLFLSPVNILERKNIEYCIDIIFQLKKLYPNILYIISGHVSRHRSTAQYYEILKTKVEKLLLSENVLFLTDIVHRAMLDSELHDLYGLSDIIFYFSKSENFGLPLLEAGLSKTPIFVSNLQVFHEIGEDNINYIDFKTKTPSESAQIIHNFIESDKRIKANHHMRTKYDLKQILITKLLPILKN